MRLYMLPCLHMFDFIIFENIIKSNICNYMFIMFDFIRFYLLTPFTTYALLSSDLAWSGS
jgi:hypothetical protein